MILNTEFLNDLVIKYSVEDLTIHITDMEARILASTDSTRMGTKSRTAQHILQIIEPLSTQREDLNNNTGASFGKPIFHKQELYGSVVVHGPSDIASRQGELIHVSIESALEYANYFHNGKSAEKQIASIARMLLEDTPDTETLLSLMNNYEIDPTLLRTVICISLKFDNPGLLNNIHLNLGYQSSNEKLRSELISRLKENKYFNSQDILCYYNEDTIAIIKSFIPSSEPAKVFPALDIICHDLEKTLEEFHVFSYCIAYGNMYSGIINLKKSLDEALEIIRIGQRGKPNERFIVLDQILFDKVCRHLDPQIISKMIQPLIKKLNRKDGTLPDELIDCVEAFVDNCMSFSETAKNHLVHRNTISTRLEKLKHLTGLDPLTSFKDAFLIKMLATYIRQHTYRQEAASGEPFPSGT